MSLRSSTDSRAGDVHQESGELLEPRVHRAGRRLDAEVPLEPVDHETRETVAFVIHQPAVPRVLDQPSASIQRSAKLACNQAFRPVIRKAEPAHRHRGLQIKVGETQGAALHVHDANGLATPRLTLDREDLLTERSCAALSQAAGGFGR